MTKEAADGIFNARRVNLFDPKTAVGHRRTWAHVCQTGTPASSIRASFGFFNVFISPMWFFFSLRCKMKNWFSPNTPHFWLTHTNNCRQPARRSVNSLICAGSVSTPLAKQVWERCRWVPRGCSYSCAQWVGVEEGLENATCISCFWGKGGGRK